jgi:hypothetical protein
MRIKTNIGENNITDSLCPPHEEDICFTLRALYVSVKAGVVDFLAPTEMNGMRATEI